MLTCRPIVVPDGTAPWALHRALTSRGAASFKSEKGSASAMSVFDPELLKSMRLGYQGACQELGIATMESAALVRNEVACLICQLADLGVTEPESFRRIVVGKIRSACVMPPPL